MGKFKIGQVLATRGVLDVIGFEGAAYALMLHASDDYGDICERDREINDWSIENGERIVSVYEKIFPQKVYVITERDRSATTVMLASEY